MLTGLNRNDSGWTSIGAMQRLVPRTLAPSEVIDQLAYLWLNHYPIAGTLGKSHSRLHVSLIEDVCDVVTTLEMGF